MDETRKSCVEETQCDRGDFAGGHQRNWNPPAPPGPSTLDYSRGQEIRKVCPPEDAVHNQFLQSGLAADMEDQCASHTMMEKAMPFISSGTANFAFRFNKNLTIRTSVFEGHGQFVYSHDCGKGATGEVQAFTDPKTALKFVRKRYKKTNGQKDPIRKEEVQSLVQLSHPGVVRLYALLCNRGTIDLLMEDCGYPLTKLLKKLCIEKISGEKYWKVIEDLGRQGFEALMYIHRKGIVHLDVKPENFLAGMGPNKQGEMSLKLVLADFGSAVALSKEMALDMPLTPHYWPPELWLHFENHVKRLTRGVKDVYRFFPKESFDTFAMGLCVNYMGRLSHLLKDLEDRQKTDRPVVPPQSLHQACLDLPGMDPDSVFKLIVMKNHAYEIPKLATRGPWLFPGIPTILLEVIQGTLHPDPEQRWTDEQAATFLAGKRTEQQQQVEENRPGVETLVDLCVPSPQPGMNAPIQVQDPDMGGCPLPEQAQGQFIPVPEASLLAPDIEVGAATDTPDWLNNKPKMSENRKDFSQRFMPLLQPWSPKTTSLPQGASQLNEGFRTPVSIRTGAVQVEQNDMVIGSHSQKIQGPPQQASTRSELGAENKTEAGVLKQKGIERARAEGSTGEKVMKSLEKTEGKIMIVAENLEKLAMQNTDALAQQTPNTGGSKGAVYGKGGGKGKGALYGKGGGKRKPVRPGGKREESKELLDKVKAGSAITKIRSPGKTINLHARKMPLVSGQGAPPHVHFPVASSSHPQPQTHTLALRTGNTPPQSGQLDRPPDGVSAGPSFEHYYSGVQSGRYGSSSERGAAGGGLPITGGACIASYAPGQSGVSGLENPMEELIGLLDEKGLLSQLVPGPGYGGILEQHPVTEMGQTLFVNTAAVGDADQCGMENEAMADISEGMPMDVEDMAAGVEAEASGNVPHFNMIFDL